MFFNQIISPFYSSIIAHYTTHLFSFGANNNLGTAGQVEGEDFFVTCRVGSDSDSTYSTHVRCSFSFADAYKGGLLNGCYPSTKDRKSVV